jgi:hypothetical protein
VRLLARLLLVVGAVGVGAFLFRASPRDVVVAYGVRAPGAPAILEVELRRGQEVLRRAELAVPAGGGEIRHPVRLQDGDYLLVWRLSGGSAAWRGDQRLSVDEDATVAVPVGP